MAEVLTLQIERPNVAVQAAIRVLVIDDNEDDYRLFDVWLEECSSRYRTAWCGNYVAGRHEIQRGIYDVVLLDYRLGAESGMDLLKESIAMGNDVPVILVTGFDDPNIDHQSMSLGASDYVVKSRLDAWMLDRVIRHSIDRHQAIRNRLKLEKAENTIDTIAKINLQLSGPAMVSLGHLQMLQQQLGSVLTDQQAEALKQAVQTGAEIVEKLRRVVAVVKFPLQVS